MKSSKLFFRRAVTKNGDGKRKFKPVEFDQFKYPEFGGNKTRGGFGLIR